MSDDTISRHAAYATVLAMYVRCDTENIEDYRDLMCESILALPSAQPEHATCYLDSPCEYQNINIALPPVQPEIIRCGKCTHKDKKIDYCHYLGITICESDFCSYAVRRTE